MGRYAFFSTGFEYKFWFAIQPSEDILEFGGNDITKKEESEEEVYEDTLNLDGMMKKEESEEEEEVYEEPEHEWTKVDLPYIHAKLLVFAKDNAFTLPAFDTFEKTTDGTYEMYKNMDKNILEGKEKAAAYFCLGCVIYHQLLWNDELSATYEL